MAVLAVVVVVGLIAGAYAAGTDDPALTADEAVTFTREALSSVGAQRVEVSNDVRAETFTPEGRDPIAVWVVPATVSDQPLELYVAQQGGRAVNLDDALPDGGFVLTEEQFAALEQFRLDLAGQRVAEQRRIPATAAGVLVVVVGVALLLLVVTGRSSRRAEPEA